MTEHCVTTSKLANEMLAMANKVDRARVASLAECETWAALQHLMESLEAAERAAAGLRSGYGSTLAGRGGQR